MCGIPILNCGSPAATVFDNRHSFQRHFVKIGFSERTQERNNISPQWCHIVLGVEEQIVLCGDVAEGKRTFKAQSKERNPCCILLQILS